MVKKTLDWKKGVELDDHTKRKLKILEKYFEAYLRERCKNPIARGFRLAIIEGFSGGGKYKDGSHGSPIIFVNTLLKTVAEINEIRLTQGMPKVSVHCLMILNDSSRDAIELLRENIAPYLAKSKDDNSNVNLEVELSCEKFEDRIDYFINNLKTKKIRNVIYTLDQCGYRHVNKFTIEKLVNSSISVEIFLTLGIQSLLTYLSKTDTDLLNNQLRHFDLTADSLNISSNQVSNPNWMAAIERAVFYHFCDCAPYMTPFSIHNPKGWRYWFMHFAKSYRARQVYNDVLHDNSSQQAHFGKAGLNMLSYNPDHDRAIKYLFDDEARKQSRDQLSEDIAKMIREGKSIVRMDRFYETVYNETPAHSDDIHSAIIDNPDLEITTPRDRPRTKVNRISLQDTIKYTRPPMFDAFNKKN